MPIPKPPTTLTFPIFDEVETYVERPRECLRDLRAIMLRRKATLLMVPYSPEESFMLLLAHGATSQGPYPVEDFRALLLDAGGDPTRWLPPTDRLTAINRLVLPLANYVNLSLGLGRDNNWDRGITVLRGVNAKLARWFERQASLSSEVIFEGGGAEASGDIFFVDWAEGTERGDARAGRGSASERSVANTGEASRYPGDYVEQVESTVVGSRDALVASMTSERVRAFKRNIALRHDALSVRYGSPYDHNDILLRDPEEERRADVCALRRIVQFSCLPGLGGGFVGTAACAAFGIVEDLGMEGYATRQPQKTTKADTTGCVTIDFEETVPDTSEFKTAIKSQGTAAEQRARADLDEIKFENLRTAYVSPYSQFDNDRGGTEDLLRAFALRMNATTRFSETERASMTAEQILDAAIVKYDQIINWRPGDDRAMPNPQEAIAEALARIERITNPGRRGGGS